MTVTAERKAHEVWLSVIDDGPSPPDAHAFEDGVGLGNTRKRLAELYGARQRLVVSPVGGGETGTRVTVDLPMRVAIVAPPDGAVRLSFPGTEVGA